MGSLTFDLLTCNFHSVKTLFEDASITFVGNNIHNDITVLLKDYPELAEVFQRRGGKRKNMINLSTYARRRDVIQSDSAKLSLLVQRTLNKNLPKDPNNTFSTWNQAVLDADQEKYAALDVIAHLLVYEKLESMTDLEQRLKKTDLHENQVVD